MKTTGFVSANVGGADIKMDVSSHVEMVVMMTRTKRKPMGSNIPFEPTGINLNPSAYFLSKYTRQSKSSGHN